MISKINNIEVEYYDSIEELPSWRFQMYNINVLIDAGIGSTVADVVRHGHEANRCIDAKKYHEAKQANLNMNKALEFVISKSSPKMRSFAYLIRKINGRVINDEDLTADGVDRIIKELSAAPIGWIKKILAAVKKKIDFEFELFFKSIANTGKVINYYNRLRRLIMLMVAEMEKPGTKTEQIKQIDNFFFTQSLPKKYDGTEGLEVAMIANYEKTCILLRQNNVSENPKKMITIAFYKALEIIKEQNKPKQKKGNGKN